MFLAPLRRRGAAIAAQLSGNAVNVTAFRAGCDASRFVPVHSFSSDPNSQSTIPESFSHTVPDGDDKERLVCDTCGFVRYENPLLVCGVLATVGDKLLLVKRDIEPRKGFWTIPGGFMECGESTEAGMKGSS